MGKRDHSTTRENRIFGPPGTGKTTRVKREISRAVHRFGDDSVLVTSFSRAAATELISRDLPIDLDRIGTLHSLCYHALGKPMIAEVQAEEWNRANPRLTTTPVLRQRKLDGEDSLEDEQVKEGDRLLHLLNCCRALMLPPEKWPLEVRDFNSKWTRSSR